MNTFSQDCPGAVPTAGLFPAFQPLLSAQQPDGPHMTGMQAIRAPVFHTRRAGGERAGWESTKHMGQHPRDVAAAGTHPSFHSNLSNLSPLCRAAFIGDTNTVLAQLHQGCAVNAWEQGEARCYTPLIAAAENGHTDIVELLIGAGADVNMSNGLDGAALYCAATHGHQDVVCVLLNAEGIRANEKMLDGSTAFYQAVSGGHVAAAKALLNGGGVPFALRQDCLVSACRRGDIAVVELLCHRGGMGLTELNRNCCLHLAAAGGGKALVAWLLACGVTANASGIGNLTPLEHACLGGHTAVVGQLLAYLGVHVDDHMFHAKPLLYLAVEAGHINLMKYLLDSGASPNAQEPRTGRTVLMAATCKGRIDMLQMLLDCPAIKPDLVCRSGWSALHLASLGGERDAAICLLDAGAHVEAPNDHTYRHSLLWGAVERKDGELFRLMLKQTGVVVGKSAPFFNAAWSHATQSGCADIVECLLDLGHAEATRPELVRYLHQASSKNGHAASIGAVWKAKAHHASAMAAGRSSSARSEYDTMIHGLENYEPVIVTIDLRLIKTMATGSWPTIVARSAADDLETPLQTFDRLIAPTEAAHPTLAGLRESLLLHLHEQRLLMAVALPLADWLTGCSEELAQLSDTVEAVDPRLRAMYYAAALSALDLQEQAVFAARLYTLADVSADGIKRLSLAAQGQLGEVGSLASQAGSLLGKKVMQGIIPACMKRTNARYEVDIRALVETLMANGLLRPLAQVVADSWNASVTALLATPLAIPPGTTFFHITQIMGHAMHRLGQTHFAAKLLAGLDSTDVLAALRQMAGTAGTRIALPALLKIQTDQLRRYCGQLMR